MNLKISITEKPTKTFVINEFEDDKYEYRHKYRDFKYHLIIKKGNLTLIDTILTKKNFVKNTEEKFLEIARFYGYWFNKIENNKIELFGIISKPETDYSYAFKHYFDLKRLKFEIKTEIEDEEI